MRQVDAATWKGKKGKGGKSDGKGKKGASKGGSWTSPKGYGKEKGKKGKKGEGKSPPFEGECSYCNIWGHKRADCRKRKHAEGGGSVAAATNAAGADAAGGVVCAATRPDTDTFVMALSVKNNPDIPYACRA
eukprot:969589-Heterocapsa_arctica.AAC.1